MAIFDENDIRYNLYSRPSGYQKSGVNWLFLPGGPGADSCYLKSLADCLDIPGNIWLIDFPGNGNNHAKTVYHHDAWFKICSSIATRFENSILVGHSFGGMFPLLFPEFEHTLKGFVILSSTPSFSIRDATEYAKQFHLPDISQEMEIFIKEPSHETFKTALNACMPYYFPFYSLEKGRSLMAEVPFQFEAAVWWQNKVRDFVARWIPKSLPTLIINGYFDCICPHTVFQKDRRFHRSNIEMHVLKECGHFPWIEKPEKVNELFKSFTYRVLNAACFAIAT